MEAAATLSLGRITRIVGVLDLLVAGLLVLVPFTATAATIGLPGGGCEGLGVVFWSWGAAVVVAVCGAWLLAHPRTGRHVALVLGVASLLGVAALTIDSMRYVSTGEALALAVFALPAVAQAPLGWMLRRLRGVTIAS